MIRSMDEQPTKPADCTCLYPRVVARNGCGHVASCPAYARWLDNFRLRPVEVRLPECAAPAELEPLP